MSALIINCSPRENGNSDAITDYVLKDIVAEVVYLRDFNYSACIGCDNCIESGACVIRDDATDIMEKVKVSDTVIFIAPVHFFGFGGHAKSFIDRAQALWNTRNGNRDKRIYLIAVGGQNFDDNFEPMIRTLKCFSLAVGGKYCGGLFFKNTDKKGAVCSEDNEKSIREFIKNTVGGTGVKL